MPSSALDAVLAAELDAAVADGLDAQLALTAALVRCPSIRGQERGVQDAVEDALGRRGYALDRWALDPRAIATSCPRARPRCGGIRRSSRWSRTAGCTAAAPAT